MRWKFIGPPEFACRGRLQNTFMRHWLKTVVVSVEGKRVSMWAINYESGRRLQTNHRLDVEGARRHQNRGSSNTGKIGDGKIFVDKVSASYTHSNRGSGRLPRFSGSGISIHTTWPLAGSLGWLLDFPRRMRGKFTDHKVGKHTHLVTQMPSMRVYKLNR